MPDDVRLASCLERFSSGDTSARDDLVGLAIARMQAIAHRMLRTFPTVQRWEQTDDVVQNASIRLHRALQQVVPTEPHELIALAATQVRRELLDLARKHSGSGSYSANHETNLRLIAGVEHLPVNHASQQEESPENLSHWTRFHEAADRLPPEEREVFGLVWYLGMKQDDVCQQLGCSIRTVKRRWEHIKQLLAQEMNGDQPS